jgi:hypothetical protein
LCSINRPFKKLVGSLSSVEIRDDEGNVAGLILPKIRPEDVDQYESPISDEEVQRRLQAGGGRPLSEILSDLRKLRP